MRPLSKILLLAVSLLAAPMATADWFDFDELLQNADRKADNRQYMIAQNDGPTLSEAVEMVRRQYNGRIVSAETKMSGNREVHLIKVLTDDGKVKTVRIPGRSRGA